MPVLMRDLVEMDGAAILKLARQIYDGAFCKSGMAGVGHVDDVVQSIALALFEFKIGHREYRGGELATAAIGIVRGESMRNWMYLSSSSGEEEGDEGFEQIDELADLSKETTTLDEDYDLAELLNISALEVILIKHYADSKIIAEFFDIAEVTVRVRRRKLFEKLVNQLDLPPDFFCESGSGRGGNKLSPVKKVERERREREVV